MRKIPEGMKAKIIARPIYQFCLRRLLMRDHECDGRITWEHVFIYAGKQVNEIWAIIPLCARAHSVDFHQDGGLLDKRMNEWMALHRMQPEDEAQYSRRNWKQERRYLDSIYGEPTISPLLKKEEIEALRMEYVR